MVFQSIKTVRFWVLTIAIGAYIVFSVVQLRSNEARILELEADGKFASDSVTILKTDNFNKDKYARELECKLDSLISK